MKILKAFLLTFIISFTMGNVNAQVGPSGPCLDSFEMDVTHLGRGCIEVIVTSDSPAYLFIQSQEDCIVESENQTDRLTAVFCTRPGSCSISATIEGQIYIECGLTLGELICFEGCWIEIDS